MDAMQGFKSSWDVSRDYDHAYFLVGCSWDMIETLESHVGNKRSVPDEGTKFKMSDEHGGGGLKLQHRLEISFLQIKLLDYYAMQQR